MAAEVKTMFIGAWSGADRECTEADSREGKQQHLNGLEVTEIVAKRF
jgi:hypothetical protein